MRVRRRGWGCGHEGQPGAVRMVMGGGYESAWKHASVTPTRRSRGRVAPGGSVSGSCGSWSDTCPRAPARHCTWYAPAQRKAVGSYNELGCNELEVQKYRFYSIKKAVAKGTSFAARVSFMFRTSSAVKRRANSAKRILPGRWVGGCGWVQGASWGLRWGPCRDVATAAGLAVAVVVGEVDHTVEDCLWDGEVPHRVERELELLQMLGRGA